MATVRGARRALARGHTDEALVELWNALEPLRLRGDTAGLQAVAQMAEAVVESGDGSQAGEAQRLLSAVDELLETSAGGDPQAPGQVAVTVSGPSVGPEELPRDGVYGPDDFGEPDEDEDRGGGHAEAEPRGRSKTASLIWALVLGAFVLFNIVRGALGGE
jgi:hypothetical protein